MSSSTIHGLDDFPDPPTLVSLANAKLKLTGHMKALSQLDNRINDAEAQLAAIVHEAQCAINEMAREKALVEEKALLTRSYLAPIRRLPSELLSYVFMSCFEDHPCSAWVLSGVCRKWRRLALGMPKIWSKIRLLTTQHSSPDIIRLWLERSGTSVPLDIEIYLRVAKSSSDLSSSTRLRGRRSTSPASAALFYHSLYPVISGGGGTPPPVTHYVIPHPSTALPPAHTPLIVPIHDGWGSPIPHSPPPFIHHPHVYRERRNNKNDRGQSGGPRNGMHWGWIAMFYLVEHMHRWERFVFRFDKSFNSIQALKSISGDVPLLKEFEISSAEPAGYNYDSRENTGSSWIPNLNFASTNGEGSTAQPHSLQSLTLQNAPFKWSSSMFHTNLHTLNIRALPTIHLSLDRITHILHANRTSLKFLFLHFQCVTQPVLPLNPLSLPELIEFSIGGHHYLSQLIDILHVPNLEEFNIDIDAREPIEDVITSFVTRMGPMAIGIKHLSVAYGYGCGRRASRDARLLKEKDEKNKHPNVGPSTSYVASPMYYPGASVVSWAFLTEMNQLESLRVGATQMDGLLSALGTPDEDMMSGSAAAAAMGPTGATAANSWLCPNLTELALKHCHAHPEGVGKLVQAVDARNPDVLANSSGTGATVVNGVAPMKLLSLELHECAVLGPDVLDWLKARVDEVVVTEPPVERSSLGSF